MANDRRDYLAAFAIGAAVGIGATLLLAPPKRKKRFVYQLEPKLARLKNRGRRLRSALHRSR